MFWCDIRFDAIDQRAIDGARVKPERGADPVELHCVEPSFTRLDPPDKRIFPIELLRQRPLGQARRFAQRYQRALKVLVLRRVGGLPHTARDYAARG